MLSLDAGLRRRLNLQLARLRGWGGLALSSSGDLPGASGPALGRSGGLLIGGGQE